MIVDSQVHLWKAETPDWPWVPGRVAQLPEPFTIEKLVPLMDEAGVDRAVIVPPSWPGDRNDYGLEAVVVAVAGPGRRHDDGAIDAGLVHQRHQLLDGERLRQLCHPPGNPGPVRRFRLPQMHL